MSDQDGFGYDEIEEEDALEEPNPASPVAQPSVETAAPMPPRPSVRKHGGSSPQPAGTAPPAQDGTKETVPVYPYVDSPRRVSEEKWFDVIIGIDPELMDDQTDIPLDVPDQFKLTMWIMAPGFEIQNGVVRFDTDVDLTEQDPAVAFPKRTARLRARRNSPDTADLSIIFFGNLQPLGVVTRSIHIGEPVDGEEEREQEQDLFNMIPAKPERELDLTLWIRRTGLASSVYNCVVVPARAGFKPLMNEFVLGEDPEEWLSQTMELLDDVRGEPTARNAVLAVARQVVAKLPSDLPELVVGMRNKLERPPRVLILTEDVLIPWELAAIELHDSDEIGVLGSIATVGRWTTKGLGEATGRADAPASKDLELRDIRMVAGDYANPLEHSKLEQEHLTTHYGARPVAATQPEILRCLNVDSDWDLLHLAVHGKYNPDSQRHGLHLADDNYVSPAIVQGAARKFKGAVFLNACLVGGGEKVLGDWGGMPAGFLSRGAEVVIAAWWSVDDALAKEVSLSVYGDAAEVAPAETLRRWKEKFDLTSAENSVPMSVMAYQFHGHPTTRFIMNRVSEE